MLKNQPITKYFINCEKAQVGVLTKYEGTWGVERISDGCEFEFPTMVDALTASNLKWGSLEHSVELKHV